MFRGRQNRVDGPEFVHPGTGKGPSRRPGLTKRKPFFIRITKEMTTLVRLEVLKTLLPPLSQRGRLLDPSKEGPKVPSCSPRLCWACLPREVGVFRVRPPSPAEGGCGKDPTGHGSTRRSGRRSSSCRSRSYRYSGPARGFRDTVLHRRNQDRVCVRLTHTRSRFR